MPISFRFRLIPFLASVVVAAAGLALGQWQTHRAHEKEAIEAKLEERASMPAVALNTANLAADDLEYRQVTARGHFVSDWPLYLDNRPYHGSAGFYVLMPFQLEGARNAVLVVRGWLPRNAADRTRLPPLVTPRGELEIHGMVKRDAGHILQLGSEPTVRPGAILQNVDMVRLAGAIGMTLAPFVVEQRGDGGDGLVRDWPRASLGVERHWGYAFQWYALAATAIIFFVVTGIRSGTKEA